MLDLVCYKVLPEWRADNLPKGFRRQHNTKVGTWAKLNIISGKLTYYSLNEAGEVLDSVTFNSDSDVPFVEPQAWHKVEPVSDDLRVQLSFYCRRSDYYHKKYKLTAPHSEVMEALDTVSVGTALDIGCGRGRNALLLQQAGFAVTALDNNAESIATLNSIISDEGLSDIQAMVADAVQFAPTDEYDLILSTVVLMFLPPNSVPEVIGKMQSAMKSGGYNLIVCAVDSPDYPVKERGLPFGFALQPGELADYYQGWKIIKYNEDVGHLHRRDAQGNFIPLRFATLLAQHC